jgi:NAD(P)-dependent dehydrogenase (short-subunit alcohol dehydrogenase family)
MIKSMFVTGSAAGIGRQTAAMLIDAGHHVIVHARSRARAGEVAAALPGAAGVVTGDLASLAETRALAGAVASYGPFDAVVHNAGVYNVAARRRVVTGDGLEETFQVNVLAPYLLTALMPLPGRLIYVGSGMASGGTIVLDDLQREQRRWSASGAYSDSKLCLAALALAIAGRYPHVTTTYVGPGWVRTRMGGSHAPVDLRTGAATQVWLASSDAEAALRSGRYLQHMDELSFPQAATDPATQGDLLAACQQLSGTDLPPPSAAAG